jgi:hypothetical protein
MKLNRSKLVFGLLIGFISLSILLIGFSLWQDSRISAREILATNITDSSFSITWMSDEPYQGRIIYQEGEGWRPLFAQSGLDLAWDDRDTTVDSGQPRYTHHVTVKKLKPDTTYSFRIAGAINGKELSLNKVKTKPVSTSAVLPDVAYGDLEGVDSRDSLVILEYNPKLGESESSFVSAVVTDNSTYSFDKNFLPVNVSVTDLIAFVRSSQKVFPQFFYTETSYKPLEKIELVEPSSVAATVLGAATGACPNSASESVRVTTDNCYYVNPANPSMQAVLVRNQRFDLAVNCRGTASASGGSEFQGWCVSMRADGQPATSGAQPPITPNPPTVPNPPTTPNPVPGDFDCNKVESASDRNCWDGCLGFSNANKSDNLVYCRTVEKNGQVLRANEGCYTQPGATPDTTNDYCNSLPGKGGYLEQFPYAPLPGVASIPTPQVATILPTLPQEPQTTTQPPTTPQPPVKPVIPEVACWQAAGPQKLDLGDNCSVSNDLCVSGSRCQDGLCVVDEASACAPHNTVSTDPNQSEPDLCQGVTTEGTIKLDTKTGICHTCSAQGLVLGAVACPVATAKSDARAPQQQIATEPVPLVRSSDEVWKKLNIQVDHMAYGTDRERLIKGYLRETPLDAKPAFAILHWTGNASNPQCADGVKIRFTPQSRSVDGEIQANSCSNFIVNQDGTGKEIVEVGRGCIQAHNRILNSGYGVSIENCGAGDLGRSLTNSQVLANTKIIAEGIDAGKIERNVCVLGHFQAAPPPLRYDPGRNFVDAVCKQLKDAGYPIRCATQGECNPQPDSVAFAPQPPRVLAKSIVTEIKAEDTDTLNPGFYNIELQGYMPVKNVYIENGEEVNFYLDANANSQRDPGEEIVDLGEQKLQVTKESASTYYRFNAGWNAFAVNGIVNSGDFKASDLLGQINSSGGEAKHVAQFIGGKWQIYTQRGYNSFNEDFQIKPATGYMVFVGKAAELTLDAQTAKQSFPISFSNGWNLVGFTHQSKVYDAKTLLSDLDKGKIVADTVSTLENGRYNSLVLKDGSEFGNNYNLLHTRSYFIRVESTTGQEFSP